MCLEQSIVVLRAAVLGQVRIKSNWLQLCLSGKAGEGRAEPDSAGRLLLTDVFMCFISCLLEQPQQWHFNSSLVTSEANIVCLF